MTPRTIRVILITVAFMLSILPVLAQDAAVQTTDEPEVAATVGVTIDDSHSYETQREFIEILRRYPPELGMVLKLDPTLLEDRDYLVNYPALAKFSAEHPQLSHNPAFFLSDISSPLDSGSSSMRAVERILESMTVFTFIVTFILFGVWLVRTFVEQRRWTRLSRVQTEVHSKILDRLTSNEELLSYIQTTAGRKFLESAPIPLGVDSSPVSAPVNRILWSVQLGIVVAAGAAGMMWVSGRFEAEVAQSLSAMGVIALCVGLGFVLSAGASLALSQRLGLWGSEEQKASGIE